MRLDTAMRIVRLVLQFGQVRRATMHEDGQEYETDTTHTVMLGLLAIEIASECGCDPGLAAQFALVHDLPEAYAGDTNTAGGLSSEEAEAKLQRELAAMRRLTAYLGSTYTLTLLRVYEAQEKPEARLVRYLDKVLPKLTHRINGGAALRALGLTSADMRRSHANQGSALAAQYPEMDKVRQLFEDACAAVEAGVADGTVRMADAP